MRRWMVVYTFYINSDGGSRLFIRGHEVVNNDGVHGQQELAGQMTLLAGRHELELNYFIKDAPGTLTVEYQGPNFTRRAIPTEYLFQAGCSRPQPDFDGKRANFCPVGCQQQRATTGLLPRLPISRPL